MDRTLSQANVLNSNSAAAVDAADQSQALGHPDAGIAFAFLWLFTFWVFGRPEDIFSAVAPLHLTFIFGASAGVAFVGALVFSRARLRWSREFILVLLLSGWFILGLPFAYWRGGSYQMLMGTWVKTIIGFFLLTQTLTTIGRIRKLLWAIVFSELFATSASIVLQGKEALRSGDRVIGVNQGMLGNCTFRHTTLYRSPLHVSSFTGANGPLDDHNWICDVDAHPHCLARRFPERHFFSFIDVVVCPTRVDTRATGGYCHRGLLDCRDS